MSQMICILSVLLISVLNTEAFQRSGLSRYVSQSRDLSSFESGQDRSSLALGMAEGQFEMYQNMFIDEGGEEDVDFKRITKTYLMNKYRDCKEDPDSGDVECRFMCDEAQIRDILIDILPPVNLKELNSELRDTMIRFKDQNMVEADEFVNTVIMNSYWIRAGELVVKELIFLDCVHAYYFDKQVLLDDDDYNELKDMLTWEGSDVATLTGKEALFISAVAGARRQKPILSDDEYTLLKRELQGMSSWVVKREPDALEKLGLNTFMGYLHNSMQ